VNTDGTPFVVASVATAIYAYAAFSLRRTVVRRKWRRARREVRFVVKLTEGARNGTVRSLSEAIALYQADLSLIRPQLPDLPESFWIHHLIGRALTRHLRHQLRLIRRRGAAGRDFIDGETDEVLRRLQRESHALAQEEWARIASQRYSPSELERIQKKNEQRVARWSAEDAVALMRRRKNRDKILRVLCRGLLGAGCIAFILATLKAWQSWR